MEVDETHKSKLIDTHVLHSNRPLSPHLSIYRLQLTSGLSILHRITGAYLYFGLVIFAWSIFALTYFPNILERTGGCINGCKITNMFFYFVILTWAFSLFYHLLNGIRHLFWDIGKGFDLKTTYITGKIVVVLSIILTLICWYFASIPLDNVEEVTVDAVVIENQE